MKNLVSPLNGVAFFGPEDHSTVTADVTLPRSSLEIVLVTFLKDVQGLRGSPSLKLVRSMTAEGIDALVQVCCHVIPSNHSLKFG